MSKQDGVEDPAVKDNGQGTEGGADADQKFKDQQKRAEKAEAEAKAAKELAATTLAEKAELERQIAEAADSKGEVSDEDLEKLAKDNDVSIELLKGLSSMFEKKFSKKGEAESLVNSKLSEKEKELAKERILNDFKRDFDKVETDWEGSELSEGAVRLHYLTEKAKNPDHTVADSVEEIYGSFKSGKVTAEDDPKGAGEAGESIDFNKVSKNPEQLAKVLKDPKATKAYYKWRDEQGM